MDALLRRRNMIAAGGGTPAHTLVYHEYLVFDGDCGIETDIVIPENGSIRAGLGSESVKAAQGVFQVGNTTIGRIRLYYGGSTTSTKRNLAVDYDSTSYVAYDNNLNFSSDRYAFFITPNGFGYGSFFKSFTKGNLHPNTGLVVGSESGSRRYTGKVGYFRIYGSDAASCQSSTDFGSYTPIYYLRPCTYDGVPGLWCVETNTFYGKTLGSGTLSVAD